ncbi:MAG: metallophosphoesterase [Chlorobi bacterium]|nr:metallophosphoesterase [Chlorobiota bacterium]
MRRSGFIVFLGIVLSIYTLACLYVYLDYKIVIQHYGIHTGLFLIIYVLICSFFITGRFLERIYPRKSVFLLVKAGAYWLGMLLYLFLFLVTVDLIFGFLHAVNLIGPDNRLLWLIYLRLMIFFTVFLLLVYGYFNALHTRIREITIKTPKLPSIHEGVKIFVATDVHLGSIRGQESLSRLVKLINNSKSDLVIFGGDTLDEDIAPVIAQNLGDCLRKIRATYGVYGIPGNHEYIGGISSSLRYLQEQGIQMLMDETVGIAGKLLLIGRTDRDIKRFTGKERKKLSDLSGKIHDDRFSILLDHQPFGLDEAADLNLDLQISGHTHDGQLWPFNMITRRIYEISTGYLKKRNTHFVVSSGYGTWGPPLRIGTTPEVWIIHLLPVKDGDKSSPNYSHLNR